MSRNSYTPDQRRLFGENLERLMQDRGWNQSELARQAARHMPEGKDFGRDCVSGYICGDNVPQPVRLKALCAALGCEPKDLLQVMAKGHGAPRRAPAKMTDLGDGTCHVTIDVVVQTDVARRLFDIASGRGNGSFAADLAQAISEPGSGLSHISNAAKHVAFAVKGGSLTPAAGAKALEVLIGPLGTAPAEAAA